MDEVDWNGVFWGAFFLIVIWTIAIGAFVAMRFDNKHALKVMEMKNQQVPDRGHRPTTAPRAKPAKAGPSVHVVWSKDKKIWRIKCGGKYVPNHDGTARRFPTKIEAMNAARALAVRTFAELVIHNRDGRISEKDSHGFDSGARG